MNPPEPLNVGEIDEIDEHLANANPVYRARVKKALLDHRDLYGEMHEVFSAIEGGFGVMTATPANTIRQYGVRLTSRVAELEAETEAMATESVRAHAEYKARRNEQFAAYENLTDRIATIADEAFGPFPVQSADENLSAIEHGIADQHARIMNACIKLELLRDDIGGCERPVLDHDRNRWIKTIDEIGSALGARKENA